MRARLRATRCNGFPAVLRRKSSSKNGVAQRKRIVVIDDHQLLRQGLERLLDSTDEFLVCGEAGTAAEGEAVIRKTKPDAAIVDISLPDMDGISLTKRLARDHPDLPIVILSMHEEP